MVGKNPPRVTIILASSSVAEHLAVNQVVGGSIPSSPAIYRGVAQLVEHQTLALVVEGSKPSTPAIQGGWTDVHGSLP